MFGRGLRRLVSAFAIIAMIGGAAVHAWAAPATCMRASIVHTSNSAGGIAPGAAFAKHQSITACDVHCGVIAVFDDTVVPVEPLLGEAAAAARPEPLETHAVIDPSPPKPLIRR